MINNYRYTIILQPDEDEGGYTVTVPALPGCITQGETMDEAIEMAKDAILLHIESLIAEKQQYLMQNHLTCSDSLC